MARPSQPVDDVVMQCVLDWSDCAAIFDSSLISFDLFSLYFPLSCCPISCPLPMSFSMVHLVLPSSTPAPCSILQPEITGGTRCALEGRKKEET
jgi:hypothetical protein